MLGFCTTLCVFVFVCVCISEDYICVLLCVIIVVAC